ncbi:MAG TPA: class I adenylate-forming enzyme family protein [Polyangiales bacterium]
MTDAPAPDVWRTSLAHNAHERGTLPAITRKQPEGGFESLSHAALYEKALAYESVFRAHTEPGQVIPLLLARTGECAAAMHGALLAGRAFCTLNPKLRIPQLEYVLAQLRSPLALVDGQGLLALRGEIAADSALMQTTWHVCGGSSLSRHAERVTGELALRTRVVRHDREPLDGLPRLPDAAREVPAPPDDAPGCCLFTSGSTGTPKGVLISRGDLRARAIVEQRWLALDTRDVVLNVLPFSFDVGLNQLFATMHAGAELVVLESWLPADVLTTVAARSVTGIAAVPMIWGDFLAHGCTFDRKGAHASLRYITVSGGDLSPTQHRRLPEIAPGARIFKTYGQTEAFRITSLRPEDYAERPLSVGRALPGGHVYVLREDLSPAGPGELGEVVHTGVGTMLGYLGDPRQADKLRRNPCQGPHDANAVAVFTGDMGQLDSEGYLTLCGRRDELVKIAGNRVYPAEVKALVSELPELAIVEVVPVPAERGTELVAFVVPRDGAHVDGAQLRRALSARAPSYMVPARIEPCRELPRTASGKPDRPVLQQRAAALLRGEN